MYESMNEVYKLVIPVYEHKRSFEKLEKIHGRLQSGYQKIVSKSGKRFLATFFRVGFYGSLFNDLDKQEFVYKEEGHTHLAEFSLRLEVGVSLFVGVVKLFSINLYYLYIAHTTHNTQHTTHNTQHTTHNTHTHTTHNTQHTHARTHRNNMVVK